MFSLFTISSGLDLNHTSISEKSEIKVFENINLLGEISNNWSNDLLWANVYRILESCWLLLILLH